MFLEEIIIFLKIWPLTSNLLPPSADEKIDFLDAMHRKFFNSASNASMNMLQYAINRYLSDNQLVFIFSFFFQNYFDGRLEFSHVVQIIQHIFFQSHRFNTPIIMSSCFTKCKRALYKIARRSDFTILERSEINCNSMKSGRSTRRQFTTSKPIRDHGGRNWRMCPSMRWTWSMSIFEVKNWFQIVWMAFGGCKVLKKN